MLLTVMGLAFGIVGYEGSVFAIIGDVDEPVADAVITFDCVTNNPGNYAFSLHLKKHSKITYKE
jgi:hypothetical protein